MRHTTVAILAAALVVTIGDCLAQSPLDVQRATREVTVEGIAVNELHRAVTFYTDFIDYDSTIATTLLWTKDRTGALDTVQSIRMDSLGTLVALNAAGAAESGMDVQMTPAPFFVRPGYPLEFESRFKIGELANCKFAVGLSELSPSPTDTLLGVGLVMHDGDSLLSTIVRKAKGSQDSTDAYRLNEDTLWIVYRFEYDGAHTINHYIAVADTAAFRLIDTDTTTANLPGANTGLKPTFAVRSTATLGTTSVHRLARMWMQYIWVRQQRSHFQQ